MFVYYIYISGKTWNIVILLELLNAECAAECRGVALGSPTDWQTSLGVG